MEDFSIYDEILQKIKNVGLLNISSHSHYVPYILRLKAEGLVSERSPFFLRKEGYRAIELGGFKKWLEKESSQHHNTSKQLNNYGNINFGNKSNVLFFSDESSIDIKSDEEVINALKDTLELVRNSQNIDAILKAKYIDLYEELQSTISKAKEDNLPILDNLLSIAASAIAILSAIPMR